MLMMKLLAVLITMFLVGCASVQEKEPDHPVKELKKERVKKEKVVVPEKVTAITPEVLYLLMTAEIAGQRKQYGVALEGYLQAAKHVDDPQIAERAAKIGLFLKDTKKTDEAVSLWLKRDEKNLSARKIAILSALRGSDKDNAVKHLGKVLKDDPAGFEPTIMEVLQILEKEGNTEFVSDVMEEVSVQHPNQSGVLYVQALLAGQLKRQDVAITKVNAALAVQPDWEKALILRAQLAAQKGDLGLAKKDLNRVLEKNPENERVQKMLAQILVKEENFDGALQIYQKISEANPEDGDAQFSMALVYLQQEKDDEAIDVLESLVNKPGWDAPASFYLGRIEYKKENYNKALVWFDKVTQGPFEYEASMVAISMLLKQKEYAEAESRIEKIAKKFPKQKSNTQLLKAELYSSQKDYQKAYDVLSNGLKEFPGQRDLLYTRALIAEKLDKLEVVEKDLLQVLQQDPNDANALNALGYTLADRTDRYEDAEKYLLRALKLKPDEAVIIDSLGWLRFKQGKFKEALDYLESAYEKQAENEIAAHIVEVLWAMGKKDEAKNLFDKVYKKAPDDEFLLKTQRLFNNVK